MEERYSRQELFSGIGSEGQALLAEKHVLIIGAGALGSANAEMLVRAGVGKITIVDRDYVEWSNLGRQQLYTEEDALTSLPKAKAAEQKLLAINSRVKIVGIAEEFHAENAEQLVESVDILIDGTDNFNTRFIINDVTCKLNVPWVYGGCLESHGTCLAILPGKTPCLKCLFDYLPQEGGTCDTLGIIGPAVQMTAAYQTAECLKFLTGQLMSPEMVYFDVWERQSSSVEVTKLLDPECSSCSSQADYPFLKKEKGLRTYMLCGRETVQVRPGQIEGFSLKALNDRIKQVTSEVRGNGELLIFQINHLRFVVFKDGRTLIHGISDTSEAQKLYQQYIGA
ncbi:ThiF family adenylyltransferase [Halobacillus campisalis]|uniref:ThiF family adenylyltransferase n=1 Tax=Halobacillus campisalis TaxID=435909 RepID=A0ABW2K4S1_9BACI|nr:ThiF family adenylyltransferase [Halobacillus campisalis]